jgi:hypothetical protein
MNTERQPQFRPTKSPEEQPISDDIVTIPNIITVLGGILSLYGIKHADSPKGMAALVAGELSDKVDGSLAEALGQRSKLGTKLDPIRDKIVAAAALLKLLQEGSASKAMVATIAGLESTKAIATAVAEYKHNQLPEESEPLRPTQAGRVSSALVAATMTLLIIGSSAESLGYQKTAKTLKGLGKLGFAAYIPAAAVAAGQYVKRARGLMNSSQK